MTDKAIYKLTLHPVNSEYTPNNWVDIAQNLAQAGFIGNSIQSESESYYVGENFLQLITFLGCSPNIQIEPEEGNSHNFCQIVMSELNERVQFRYSPRDIAARCPKCRKKLDLWPDWIDSWKKSSDLSPIDCENCSSSLSLFKLNWRHSAAFARCFIDIWNIYPQEAIPTEELLLNLSETTGEEWDYFFSE